VLSEGKMLDCIWSRLNRLARDERGGEVIEYALIMGLVIVVAIAVITSVGTKVLARWQSVNSSM
jgi:pilus assembly protein Flp/PilA